LRVEACIYGTCACLDKKYTLWYTHDVVSPNSKTEFCKNSLQKFEAQVCEISTLHLNVTTFPWYVWNVAYYNSLHHYSTVENVHRGNSYHAIANWYLVLSAKRTETQRGTNKIHAIYVYCSWSHIRTKQLYLLSSYAHQLAS